MFAVLKTGGKQYRVQSGDVLRVEKLAADAGETVQFNEVLMVGGDTPVVGSPFVADAGVQAEVLDQIKGDKVIHYVRRRRKHSSKRTKGHRQQLTVLRVTEILGSGAGASGVKEAIGSGSGPRTNGSSAASAEPVPSAAAQAGAKPGNLLDAPRDGQADDLRKLSGVGPKLEKLLHESGVFHFDQIAAWNDAEIAYMDDIASLKGRFSRENWVEQAKSLAAEKE